MIRLPYIDEGPDAYYKATTLITEDSKELRIAAKTPSLILPPDRNRIWELKYLHTIIPRIDSGLLLVKYLISLSHTRDEIFRLVKEDAIKSLEKWKRLLRHHNFELRYAERGDFSSIFIGNNYTAIPLKGIAGRSTFVIIRPTEEDEFSFKHWYDETIFKPSTTSISPGISNEETLDKFRKQLDER